MWRTCNGRQVIKLKGITAELAFQKEIDQDYAK